MSPAMAEKNDAAISRMAARREVRRLRQGKQKVPAEVLAQAGFDAVVTRQTARRASRKRVECVVTSLKSGADAVRTMGQGTFKARQAAAKGLGIKNRRWMSTNELDEAINLATEKRDDGKRPGRLIELEQLGRERCRAAWDAWKAKQETR